MTLTEKFLFWFSICQMLMNCFFGLAIFFINRRVNQRKKHWAADFLSSMLPLAANYFIAKEIKKSVDE